MDRLSWYGDKEIGNKTADGTVLKSDSVWVAVPQADFKRLRGKWFRITYKGKSIEVQVKDSGGFAKYGRKWDLTRQAAINLNREIITKGVVLVEAQEINKTGQNTVTSQITSTPDQSIINQLPVKEVGYIVLILFIGYLLTRLDPESGNGFLILILLSSLVFNFEKIRNNFRG